MHKDVAAVLVLEDKPVAKMIAASSISRYGRDLRVERAGRLSLDAVPNGAQGQKQRRHTLLPVDHLQDAVVSGADNDAADEVFGGHGRVADAAFGIDIVEELLDVRCLPDILALIVGHLVEILEENIGDCDVPTLDRLFGHVTGLTMPRMVFEAAAQDRVASCLRTSQRRVSAFA